MKQNRQISGLRKRWLISTVGVVFALGMVCVMAVTAVFATNHYNDLQKDLYDRTKAAVQIFSSNVGMNVGLSEIFDADSQIAYQFLDPSGVVIVSSRGESGESPSTPEIESAVNTVGIQHYLGKEPVSGERIMAVSAALTNSSGDVTGVLRFSASTRQIDKQLVAVFGISFLVLLVILALVWVSSSYFLRSIMTPIRDITEKARRVANGSYGIQIQEQYDDEIGELAHTINDMSVKISQNEKMQAEFISQLSHELRTPLTVINGWSETLLADESMDSDTRQGMKIISGEAKRLTEMVVELLDFTRMQDGRMTLAVEPTDILAEFEDTIFMYGSRLALDGIQLHYEETMEEIPEIPCDAQRLRQVFLNILDNAAKHGGEGKRVDASICCDGENVLVQIRDYGSGIPEDEIPLVKKKFYKGSSSVRGTGIGLAVCDEIVELHGGSLTLENAEGGGTLVTVSLPVAQ